MDLFVSSLYLTDSEVMYTVFYLEYSLTSSSSPLDRDLGWHQSPSSKTKKWSWIFFFFFRIILKMLFHLIYEIGLNFNLFKMWVVQFHSVAKLCLTLCDPRDYSPLGFPVHHQLLELVGDAIQPSPPLLFRLLPPSFFPSSRVFSSESVLPIRWQKYWNFSFSMSPSNEYSGLISFRIDWFDLLAVQGTLKSLLQTTVHACDTFELWCWRRLLRVPWTARKLFQFFKRSSKSGFVCIYSNILALKIYSYS